MEALVDWDTKSIGCGADYPRFILLAGLLRERGAKSILEIGCGDGTLRKLLPDLDYTGVDVDPLVIDKARRRHPSTEFKCVDANDWTPPCRYDATVFNESLYYLQDPEEALQRFSAQSGIVAVSIFHKGLLGPNASAVKAFRRMFDGRTIYDTTLRCGGLRWDIVLARTHSE